jgi:hypothetical protein
MDPRGQGTFFLFHVQSSHRADREIGTKGERADREVGKYFEADREIGMKGERAGREIGM